MDLENLTDKKTYYWTVDASDGNFNGTDIPTKIWSFTVGLPPADRPPIFTCSPPFFAFAGEEFIFNITAFDYDRDAIAFSLVNGPKNMTIDPATGGLHWEPVASEVGDHAIEVQASDGRGGTALLEFTLTVIGQKEAPLCMITSPANGSRVNGIVQIRGTAHNGSALLKVILVRIDGGKWSNASGLEYWRFPVDAGKLNNGKHTVEARAFDGSRYSITASVEIEVQNAQPMITIGGAIWAIAIILLVAGIGFIAYIIRKRRLRRGA
jgi:hypothetical protein